jgi:hypothetical protein
MSSRQAPTAGVADCNAVAARSSLRRQRRAHCLRRSARLPTITATPPPPVTQATRAGARQPELHVQNLIISNTRPLRSRSHTAGIYRDHGTSRAVAQALAVAQIKAFTRLYAARNAENITTPRTLNKFIREAKSRAVMTRSGTGGARARAGAGTRRRSKGRREDTGSCFCLRRVTERPLLRPRDRDARSGRRRVGEPRGESLIPTGFG